MVKDKKIIKIRVFTEYGNFRPKFTTKIAMNKREFLKYILTEWKVEDFAVQNGNGFDERPTIKDLESETWSWKKGFINEISD